MALPHRRLVRPCIIPLVAGTISSVALAQSAPDSGVPSPQPATSPATTPATTPAAEPAKAEAAPAVGLVPLVDYSGPLSERLRLTGEWGGARTRMAEKGFMLDLDLTQVGQGVVSGGRRIDWDYTGSFDLFGSLDLHRMDVLKGAVVEFRVESRWGESVNDDAGSLLPVNTDAFVPITSPTNESILTVTELNYTQFLSETFALTLGKFQTLDGDPNEFASGRGRSQFMNSNFLYSSATAMTVPYSTLGGGLLWLPTDRIVLSSLMISTTDSSTTSGFQDFDEGWTWTTEADFQYKLGKLPGGANVGFAYAFAGDFTQLTGRLSLIPGQGVSASQDSESWAVYASTWQYLYTPDAVPDKLNTTNGKPDLRGVGLFGRLGFADEDTNPIHWVFAGGLGGKGLIPSRDDDLWGLGYSYTKLHETRRIASDRLDNSTQGIEAFYNIAITPAVGLTFDVQWLDSAFSQINSATVLGLRLDMRF